MLQTSSGEGLWCQLKEIERPPPRLLGNLSLGAYPCEIERQLKQVGPKVRGVMFHLSVSVGCRSNFCWPFVPPLPFVARGSTSCSWGATGSGVTHHQSSPAGVGP